MNSTSVFNRLGLAFTLLIALILGVGWLGLDRLAKTNAQVKEAVEERYAILSTGENALFLSAANSRIIMLVFMLGNTNDVGTLLANRAANTKRVVELIDGLNRQLRTPEEKSLLANVAKERAPYVKSYLHSLELVANNQQAAAISHFQNDSLPHLASYYNAWRVFLDDQARRTRLTETIATHRCQSARRVVGGMTVSGGDIGRGNRVFRHLSCGSGNPRPPGDAMRPADGQRAIGGARSAPHPGTEQA